MKIGMIGCGVISRQYLDSFDRLPDVQLVAVADLDRSRAFYERVFGFEPYFAEARMIALGVPGGGVLLLFRRGGSTRPSPALSIASVNSAWRKRSPTMQAGVTPSIRRTISTARSTASSWTWWSRGTSSTP